MKFVGRRTLESMDVLRDDRRSLLHWGEGRRSKAWEVWCENDPKNGHATEDMRDSIINPQGSYTLWMGKGTE